MHIKIDEILPQYFSQNIALETPNLLFPPMLLVIWFQLKKIGHLKHLHTTLKALNKQLHHKPTNIVIRRRKKKHKSKKKKKKKNPNVSESWGV